MKYFLIISLCVGLLSCNKAKKPIPINPRLIAFNKQYVYNVDEIINLSEPKRKAIYANSFNPKTDTVKYLKNEIYVSYLSNTPGCANWQGNIRFSKDTLAFIINADTICTEEDVWRFTFRIKNKSNKHYIIKKYDQ